MTETASLSSSTREVPLAQGGEVDVLLTANDVRIRGTDRDVVAVRSRNGEPLEDVIAVDGDRDRVVVRAVDRGLRLGPLRVSTHGAPALDIEVPRTATLTFKTLSGDVQAEGIGRDSRWSTASGDLRLAVAGGSLTADSMSGDVTIDAQAAIGIRARSVSGDVRPHAPQLDALELSSTSGDIRIAAAFGPDFEHTISSVSGDVHVDSPSPIRLDSQTIAGDVRASGVHRAEGGRGRRTILVGDGSVHLAVRTTSGDIRLRTSDGADAASPAPAITLPTPPVPPLAPAPVPPPVPEPWVVAQAEAAPNLVRPPAGTEGGGHEADAGAIPAPGEHAEPDTASSGAPTGGDSEVDRREQARLDILRALERGELDVAAASHRLEQLEEAGPRFFRGFC